VSIHLRFPCDPEPTAPAALSEERLASINKIRKVGAEVAGIDGLREYYGNLLSANLAPTPVVWYSFMIADGSPPSPISHTPDPGMS
jgi:hypothetical protein